MTQAVRASRDVPYGAWFAAYDRGVPSAGGAPVPSARRLAWEAGPSGLDTAARPRLAPPPPAGRRPSLLAAAAAHALLAAALLLAAPPAPPPEHDEAAVPLVFEPAPADTVPAPPAPSPPPAIPGPDALAAPSPAPPPPEPAPTLVLPEPSSVVPAPVPDVAAPQPPRLRPPPALRPVPQLAPAPLRPQAPARTAPAAPPPATALSRPDTPTAAAPPAGPTVAARPLAGGAGNVQPAYPEQARRRGIEGHVVVRAVVSPEGRTVSVSIAQGSGSDALDKAALDAVRGYSFAPALRGGVPVAGVADLPFTFRLAE